MISGFDGMIGSSFVWCALQVSLVATIGIIGSWITSKQNPFAACSLACSAVALVGILTLLAPLPLHRNLVDRFQTRTGSNHDDIVGLRATVQENAGAQDSSPAQGNPLWIDLHRAGFAMQSIVKHVEEFKAQPRRGFHWIRWLLLIIVAVGLMRFVVGVEFVLRIRRGSHRLSDERVVSILQELQDRVACRKSIDIREHAEFKDAAVAGWWKPMLILPCDWRHWNDDDLRAAIAHELAHIVHNDSRWRLIAASIWAIHSYNPAVYWLIRRVTIYQELAADALAATWVGRKSYLQALSRLAIRHDELSRGIAPPDVMPVFSGHLIRRIKMLNSTDGVSRNLPRRKFAGRFATSAALCLVGFVSLAARGIAESADDEKPVAGEPVTKQSLVAASAASAERQMTDPTQGMFQHRPLDPSLGIKHQDGMTVIRLREALEHPSLRQYAPTIKNLAATALSEALKVDTVPNIQFEAIEWIAATPSISFVELEEDKSENNHRLMMGLGGAVIKFRERIDLKSWFKQFDPAAKEQEIEGRTVYELKRPFLGPQPCFIWQADETTLQLCVSTPGFSKGARTSSEEIAESIKSRSTLADPTKLPWLSTWNRTDAGLVSFVLSSADLSGLNDRFCEKCQKKGPITAAIGDLIRDLRSRCKATAILLDLGNAQDVGIRLSLVHESRDSAERSAKQLAAFIDLLKLEVEQELQRLDSSATKNAGELAGTQFVRELLRVGYGSVHEHADGTASLDLSTLVQIPFLIENLSQIE